MRNRGKDDRCVSEPRISEPRISKPRISKHCVEPVSARNEAAGSRRPETRRWWALAAVSLATFMTYLDNNIVNVAIPTIQRSLHLSVSGLEWVVSSYLLTLAGLLLVGGRLADVYGRRRLFEVGLAVFTLSSLAAGLAGSGGVLIASRAVQGVGAALLMPATLAIIMATFTNARERNTAIGIWAAVSALALALGPVLGGLISQHLHWGWIFLINVPIGVITFAIAAFYVDESRAGSAVRRLDLPGLVTSALSLFALTYALIEGDVSGWTAPLILGAFVLAAVAAAAFGAIEARTANPMVDLSMFRSREFSGGSGTMMIWAFGILGIYFFTSLYLQETLGFSPTRPAWRSCRWPCASRCSRGWPRGSRRGPGRTARWRSGCCSWWPAWSCSPGSACTPATPACCPGSCCSARAPG